MATKEEVLDYVMSSPQNTNRAVLSNMLDGLGGDSIEVSRIIISDSVEFNIEADSVGALANGFSIPNGLNSLIGDKTIINWGLKIPTSVANKVKIAGIRVETPMSNGDDVLIYHKDTNIFPLNVFISLAHPTTELVSFEATLYAICI